MKHLLGVENFSWGDKSFVGGENLGLGLWCPDPHIEDLCSIFLRISKEWVFRTIFPYKSIKAI